MHPAVRGAPVATVVMQSGKYGPRPASGMRAARPGLPASRCSDQTVHRRLSLNRQPFPAIPSGRQTSANPGPPLLTRIRSKRKLS